VARAAVAVDNVAQLQTPAEVELLIKATQVVLQLLQTNTDLVAAVVLAR
jgi:hypothetical protein